MTRTFKLAPLAALAALLLSGCGTSDSEPSTDGPDGTDPALIPLVVNGSSGKQVLIDKTWDRGCLQVGDGAWQHSERTLTGLVLDWTWTDYENGSATPDCTNGRVGVMHSIQVGADDHVAVPFTWVDADGEDAAPPPGLEGVTTAIGMSATVSVATSTPETKARADELNQQKWCDITDWAEGVTHDILDCYTGGLGFNAFKATIVVDDTTTTDRIYIYDGAGGDDPDEYPSQMPNFDPHHRDLP